MCYPYRAVNTIFLVMKPKLLMPVSEVIAFCSESHIKFSYTLCWKNVAFLTLNLVVHIVTTRPQKVGEARRCDWYNDCAMGWASKVLWFNSWQRQVIFSSTKHIPIGCRVQGLDSGGIRGSSEGVMRPRREDGHTSHLLRWLWKSGAPLPLTNLLSFPAQGQQCFNLKLIIACLSPTCTQIALRLATLCALKFEHKRYVFVFFLLLWYSYKFR